MVGGLTRHPSTSCLLNDIVVEEGAQAHQASAALSQAPTIRPSEKPKLEALACIFTWDFGRFSARLFPKQYPAGTKLIVIDSRPQGIFGVPLRQSITYANVAISLIDEDGKSYIYGYVPIVVAKCGVFLKEKGLYSLCSLSRE